MPLKRRTIWKDRVRPRRAIAPGCHSRQPLLAEPDLAPGEGHLSGDGVDERRLAGTVRPDQADDLARLDAECHAVERPKTGELDGDVFGAKGPAGMARPAEARGPSEAAGFALADGADQGAGRRSGVRQPRKVGLPALSSTITAALFGTCPSSAVP